SRRGIACAHCALSGTRGACPCGLRSDAKPPVSAARESSARRRKVDEMTRILVIANETASREAAVSALQGASFDVLHVPDAKTGLILARQLQAAVIVCEIATAQEDGLWLLEQARCDPQLSAVPII